MATAKWTAKPKGRKSAPRAARPTFAFKLILAGADEITEEIENGLFEAGCDDALLSRLNGILSLIFDREAPSFSIALMSAIFDVEKAGVGLELRSVEPVEPLTEARIRRVRT